jgi:hypothetical protein
MCIGNWLTKLQWSPDWRIPDCEPLAILTWIFAYEPPDKCFWEGHDFSRAAQGQ